MPLKAGCQTVTCDMMANYDWKNPDALLRLTAVRARLRPMSESILNAGFEARKQVDAAIKTFRKIFDTITASRGKSFQYQRNADYTYDAFMMIQKQKGNI